MQYFVFIIFSELFISPTKGLNCYLNLYDKKDYRGIQQTYTDAINATNDIFRTIRQHNELGIWTKRGKQNWKSFRNFITRSDSGIYHLVKFQRHKIQ